MIISMVAEPLGGRFLLLRSEPIGLSSLTAFIAKRFGHGGKVTGSSSAASAALSIVPVPPRSRTGSDLLGFINLDAAAPTSDLARRPIAEGQHRWLVAVDAELSRP